MNKKTFQFLISRSFLVLLLLIIYGLLNAISPVYHLISEIIGGVLGELIGTVLITIFFSLFLIFVLYLFLSLKYWFRGSFIGVGMIRSCYRRKLRDWEVRNPGNILDDIISSIGQTWMFYMKMEYPSIKISNNRKYLLLKSSPYVTGLILFFIVPLHGVYVGFYPRVEEAPSRIKSDQYFKHAVINSGHFNISNYRSKVCERLNYECSVQQWDFIFKQTAYFFSFHEQGERTGIIKALIVGSLFLFLEYSVLTILYFSIPLMISTKVIKLKYLK